MKLKTLFFCSILGAISIPAWPQQEYSYKSNLNEIMFFDDFDSDVNNWSKGLTQSASVNFKNGSVLLKSNNVEVGAGLDIPIPLDYDRDFEIESSIKWIEGKEDTPFIIYWGKSSSEWKRFYIQLTETSYFRMGKESGGFVTLMDWIILSQYKKQSFNKITIRKVNQQYYFFLNETLIGSQPFESKYGNNIGFQVSDLSLIEMNYLKISYINALPPEISWISPNMNDQIVTEKNYTLKAKIISEKEIKELRLFVDGFPIPCNIFLDMAKVGNDFFLKKDIELNKGINNIEIVAITGQNETKSKPVSIEFNPNTEKMVGSVTTKQKTLPQSDVDTDIPERPIVKNRFALIIGNEDYSTYQSSIGTESDVEFAVNDATIFKTYATKTLGVEERNVFFLTNATAGVMKQKLDLVSKILTKAGPESELIFFYAGHGLPDEITKAPCLIPVDVNAADLNSAIKLADVYKTLNQTGARRITVFLDACFSGGGRNAGLLSARGVKINPKQEIVTGDFIVFSASSAEQSSLPYKEKYHGMFTYYLLKKIKISGGNLSYKELIDYVKSEVSIESLRVNYKEQDPTVNVSEKAVPTWENWKL